MGRSGGKWGSSGHLWLTYDRPSRASTGIGGVTLSLYYCPQLPLRSLALYLQQFAVLALVLLSKSAQFVIENSPS